LKRKIIILCLGILILTSMVAWIIEKKDERTLMALENERHSFKWFNEQIHLNNEIIISFSKSEAPVETVDVSVNSLRNAYQQFLSTMYALELVGTERFKKIDYLWTTYWEYTSSKGLISKNDILFLQDLGNEFTQIEEELSNEITDLKMKQTSYLWN
jgi:hypothetical protein